MAGLTSVQVAQAIGTISAAWLSGYIASTSITGVPAVVKASSNVAVVQWATIYDIGSSTAPVIAAISSASFTYAAYSLATSVARSAASSMANVTYLLCSAAVATLLIVPWTFVIMQETNNRLFAKVAIAKTEKSADVKEDQELAALLKKWVLLNLVRSTFPLLGATLGITVMAR